jgi:hypothetical protein
MDATREWWNQEYEDSELPDMTSRSEPSNYSPDLPNLTSRDEFATSSDQGPDEEDDWTWEVPDYRREAHGIWND